MAGRATSRGAARSGGSAGERDPGPLSTPGAPHERLAAGREQEKASKKVTKNIARNATRSGS